MNWPHTSTWGLNQIWSNTFSDSFLGVDLDHPDILNSSRDTSWFVFLIRITHYYLARMWFLGFLVRIVILSLKKETMIIWIKALENNKHPRRICSKLCLFISAAQKVKWKKLFKFIFQTVHLNYPLIIHFFIIFWQNAIIVNVLIHAAACFSTDWFGISSMWWSQIKALVTVI